jgi:hypothetical protein
MMLLLKNDKVCRSAADKFLESLFSRFSIVFASLKNRLPISFVSIQQAAVPMQHKDSRTSVGNEPSG